MWVWGHGSEVAMLIEFWECMAMEEVLFEDACHTKDSTGT